MIDWLMSEWTIDLVEQEWINEMCRVEICSTTNGWLGLKEEFHWQKDDVDELGVAFLQARVRNEQLSVRHEENKKTVFSISSIRFYGIDWRERIHSSARMSKIEKKERYMYDRHLSHPCDNRTARNAFDSEIRFGFLLDDFCLCVSVCVSTG